MLCVRFLPSSSLQHQQHQTNRMKKQIAYKVADISLGKLLMCFRIRLQAEKKEKSPRLHGGR